MKASWEKVENENNKGILEVEVEAEKVLEALDKAFKKVSKDVELPGFRKGKVPRQVFESHFGVESLYNDALDIILPEEYNQAVDEKGIMPVARPEIDIVQLEKGKNLIFKATVITKPEVELGEYKGIEIPEKDFSVNDEAVEEELKQLQSRHAELVVLEEGKVEQGDIAVIDFEGFLDGVAFEGGKGLMHPLEIGSGSFIPGFEEQVIGMSKDEDKDVIVTFPEEYHKDDLAGKETTFKVKLHDIKRKKVPELNDEFAKDVDFDTLDELKKDTKEKLVKKAEDDKEVYYKNLVVEKAAENTTIDIPEAMIENEIDKMIQEFKQQLSYQGMDFDLYLKSYGIDEATMREQFKENANKRVVSDLIIEAIVEKEEIGVTEEDVEEQIKSIAEMYKRDVEEIKSIFSKESEGYEKLEVDIKFKKAVDLLMENCKIVKEG